MKESDLESANEPLKLTMGAGRGLPTRIANLEDYVVEFEDAKDPAHPLNWSSWTKYVGPFSS